MSKYCPHCSSEYQNNIQVCPDDGGILTSQRPHQEKAKAIAIDIYAASSEIEAERIISLFNDEGIIASHRQSDIAQIPSSNARFLITVSISSQEKALRLLTSARHDGIITTTGIFL